MHVHRGYLPGCIGRIAELHATHYAAAAGFGLQFEAKVACELAQFCVSYEPERDGLWLAVDDGVVHGAIAIDGSHAADAGAHLRWFIVADALRGRGLGSALLDEAIAFCRRQGHGRVHLWTFAGLDAARHLYEKHGFRLEHARRGAQWGKEVDEQHFALRLRLRRAAPLR
ncbi:MAG: GNAT family N-acetyltransferase [Gammaproteobacteria bacterium]